MVFCDGFYWRVLKLFLNSCTSRKLLFSKASLLLHNDAIINHPGLVITSRMSNLSPAPSCWNCFPPLSAADLGKHPVAPQAAVESSYQHFTWIFKVRYNGGASVNSTVILLSGILLIYVCKCWLTYRLIPHGWSTKPKALQQPYCFPMWCLTQRCSEIHTL